MTYGQGNIIAASDYNLFVVGNTPNLNATWNTTYNQGALGNVSANATVGYTQWANLVTSIQKAATHQGSTVTSRTAPQAGNTITALANVQTDIGTIYTNRFNSNVASTGQYSVFSGSGSKLTATGSGAAAWTITFTHTVGFTSQAAATAFFAAGGYLKIQFGKSVTGSVADTEWNTFIGAAGAGSARVASAVYLTADTTSKSITGLGAGLTGIYAVGGVASSGNASVGFNQLTSSPVTIYKVLDTGTAYSSNYVQVNASWTSPSITLTTTWFDAGDANPGSTAALTGLGTNTTGNPISWGSAPTTLVTYFPPEVTNLSNSWGTPTITASVA
jgi:hypothetical protein